MLICLNSAPFTVLVVEYGPLDQREDGVMIMALTFLCSTNGFLPWIRHTLVERYIVFCIMRPRSRGRLCGQHNVLSLV